MKLKITCHVKNNTSCGIKNTSYIETNIQYKGTPIPTKMYRKVEKQVKKIESIMNRV